MSKLTKSEFVKGVAAGVDGLSVKQVEDVINYTFEFMKEQMKAGHSIPVPQFGTFETKLRPARTARNPQTGENFELPEKMVPVFKASAALKKSIDC